MARSPIPTWSFAVVLVRHAGRYLLVHERKHGQLWYVPAGRVEPGESFIDAAVRETLEETGIAVRLTGIVRIEHSPAPDEARMRVVFTGEPRDDRPPKSVPDHDSLGAAWYTPDDIRHLPLRGREVVEMIRHLEDGGAVHPLALLCHEMDPW